MLKIREQIRSLSRRKLVISIVILAIIVTAITLIVYKQTSSKANTAQTYTVPVQRGNIESSIDGSGTLEPSERYVLSAKASGTVHDVFVTEGTWVEKGDPLMIINNENVRSQANQALLEWEINRNDLNDLTNPSEDNYDIQEARLKVEEYEIALEDKQLEKEKLTITAPFDGTILSTHLKVGQRVSSGAEAMTFATNDEVEVVSEFSDSDLASLSIGMDTQIYVKGLNKTYTGKVKEIAFESTDTTGTFEVIISIDKPDDNLRPGMQTYNTVIVVRDIEQDVFIYKQASGYLRYAQTEDIVTEVSGTVGEIYHKPGEKVLKGEPILRLTNDEIDRQMKQAENQLHNATDALNSLLSPDEITIKQQELKVEQSYQEVLSIQDQLDSLNVVAPISGIVVNLSVKPGNELSSGDELVVVSNFEQNTLEISVDELDINKIKIGQLATVTIDALPGEILDGQVIGIAYEGATSDGVTKYPVTLAVGYLEGIKSGMTATATISIDKKENVLRIPAEALITNNNRNMVRVMENGEVKMKLIKTGLNSGTWVEVVSGLEEGEEIVVASPTNSQTSTMRMPGMGGGAGLPSGGGQRPPNRP